MSRRKNQEKLDGRWGAGLNKTRDGLCIWISDNDDVEGIQVAVMSYTKKHLEIVPVNGGKHKFPWNKFQKNRCNNVVKESFKKTKVTSAEKIYGNYQIIIFIPFTIILRIMINFPPSLYRV